jgi:hypothetical protein
VSEWIRPVLIGPLAKYAPIDAVVVARALANTALDAREGVTIIESDRIPAAAR